MKIPVTPPDHNEILSQHDGPDYLTYIEEISSVDKKGRYLHWDKLRHLMICQ